MALDSSQASDVTFALVGRPVAIRLDADGLHHPRKARGGGFAYTRYEDITHLATSSRALWIGTRASVFIIARRAFADAKAPEHLVRALLGRIGRRPRGSAQLARMDVLQRVLDPHPLPKHAGAAQSLEQPTAWPEERQCQHGGDNQHNEPGGGGHF